VRVARVGVGRASCYTRRSRGGGGVQLLRAWVGVYSPRFPVSVCACVYMWAYICSVFIGLHVMGRKVIV
jgi:hypothetical protein